FVLDFCFFFFFSSRRRHTRSKRDWSSDVCSSDLDRDLHLGVAEQGGGQREPLTHPRGEGRDPAVGVLLGGHLRQDLLDACSRDEIGRASCRERGWSRVGGGWGRRKERGTRCDREK